MSSYYCTSKRLHYHSSLLLPLVFYSISPSMLHSKSAGESAALLLSDHALLEGLEVPVILPSCICAAAALPGRLLAEEEQAYSEPPVSDWNSGPPSGLEVPSPKDAVVSGVARSPQDALARRLLCASVPSRRHTCHTTSHLLRQV